jgi:ATP-dependent Clp protease ATP-binding subunit ClpC
MQIQELTKGLTPLGSKLLAYAFDEADRLGHEEVAPQHLLLGLIRLHDGAADVIRSLSNNERIQEVLGTDRMQAAMTAAPYASKTKAISKPALRILLDAKLEAQRLQHGVFGTEHILFALLKSKASSVLEILKSLGLDVRVCEELIRKRLVG